MASKAEIRDRVGAALGLIRLNQQLKNQDKVRIEIAYDEEYQKLKIEGLATWSISSDCPSAISPYMEGLIANNCLMTYGVPQERYDRIKRAVGNNGEIAMREIRKIVNIDYVSQDEPCDF